MPPSPISSWRTSSTLFSCIGGRPRRTGTSIHRTSAEGRRGSHVGTGGAIPDDSAVTHSGGAVGTGLWAFSRGLLDPRPAPSVGVAAVAACSTHGPTDALGAGVKAHSRMEKLLKLSSATGGSPSCSSTAIERHCGPTLPPTRLVSL